MFLAIQTYKCLIISVSHVETIHFLLGGGCEYVLSERFMQDVIEVFFGHQGEKGGRSDNPTAQSLDIMTLQRCSDRHNTSSQGECWRSVWQTEMASSE